MSKYPKYVKGFATLDNNRNTLAGPNPGATGSLVNIYDIVNEGINNGGIDVTGDSLGAVVTVDGTQSITGNKTISGTFTASSTTTLSGATTISGTLAASNASITIAALPEYANDAAAGVGGLTAGRLYRTAAGAVMVKLA